MLVLSRSTPLDRTSSRKPEGPDSLMETDGAKDQHAIEAGGLDALRRQVPSGIHGDQGGACWVGPGRDPSHVGPPPGLSHMKQLCNLVKLNLAGVHEVRSEDKSTVLRD